MPINNGWTGWTGNTPGTANPPAPNNWAGWTGKANPPINSSTVFNPSQQSPLQGWQDQYNEFQRRLGSGQYDSGQFSEFQQRSSALQQMIKNYQSQNSANPATQLPDPNQFVNPALTNNYYNQALANLYQSQNKAVGGAQRTAAATAGNMLSPSAYITGAGSNVRQAYAPAFGQVEQARAGALQNQQTQLYDLLNKKALAERDWEKYGNDYSLALQQFQQQQMQYQNQYNQSNQISGWDIGKLLAGIGGQLGAGGVFGKF